MSVWVDFGYVWRVGSVAGATEGVMFLDWKCSLSEGPYLGQWFFSLHPPGLNWSFETSSKLPMLTVDIPFWAITVPTIALTVFAWRRDAAARRRALHNHCPACGYDRAGLLTPDAVCPECGAAAPTAVRP